jgi:hypothetical protein
MTEREDELAWHERVLDEKEQELMLGSVVTVAASV